METNINLKRRRDSGDGAAKKLCPEKTQPEAGPSHQTKPQPQLPPPAIPSTSTLPPPTFPPPKITLQSPPQRMPPLSPLSPQQEHFLHKNHRSYKIPLPRSQSAERAQPSSLARTPSLPSLSPSEFSSQNLFPAIPSPKRNLILLLEKRNRISWRINFQLNRCSGQRLCARWSWKQLGTSSSGRH